VNEKSAGERLQADEEPEGILTAAQRDGKEHQCIGSICLALRRRAAARVFRLRSLDIIWLSKFCKIEKNVL
jgi:hypothetical protein